MTILLFEPDCDGGEFDEAHEVGEQLVVAGCDAAELFELVEEALDDVALLVEFGVIGTLERAVPLGRNDRLAAAFSDLVAQVIGVVALVGDRDVRGEAVDQVVRESDVVALAGRADQAHRIAQRIAAAWILVLKPPRDRPRPWASAPLFAGERRQPADAPARSWSRSSAIPDRPPRQGGEDAVQNAHLDPAVIAPLHGFVIAQSLGRSRQRQPERAIHSKRVQKPSIVGARARLPFRPPGTNALSRSHWSSRSASQSTADLPKYLEVRTGRFPP